MRTIFRRIGLLTMLVGMLGVGPALAGPTAPTVAGELKVEDNANLFSADAVRKAKADFANWVSSKSGREVSIWTVAKLPDGERSKYDAINEKDVAGRKNVLSNFAKSHAKDEHAKGVFIFICKSPGYVDVLVDAEMKNKGFNTSKEDKLQEMLTLGLKDAAKKPAGEQQAARDSLLKTSVEYLETNLPAAAKDVKKVEKRGGGDAAAVPADEKKGGGLGSLLCVGLVILVVGWVLFAIVKSVIRMASGGGGGGPGYAGAPGYGGGGGGGMGFFGTFMTGMFGAAAGMWMYDSFFGHHSSQAYGNDNYGGGGGSSGTDEVVDNTGAGDFSGDNNTGGFTDDNTGGGGDWGGGGGDAGGGGDFGGDF